MIIYAGCYHYPYCSSRATYCMAGRYEVYKYW